MAYHSFKQIRDNLNKAFPYNKQKRDFILGYLEGHAERILGSSEWKISSERMNQALRKLEVGHESTMPTFRQVIGSDISKIKQQFEAKPVVSKMNLPPGNKSNLGKPMK